MVDSKNGKTSLAAAGAPGGRARAAILPPERRSDIAHMGADARWGHNLPKALREGTLEIAGRTIACAVLETKMRVLTQETFLTAVGRAGKAKGGRGSERMILKGGLPPFLAAENLEPFISDELRQAATPVVFRTLRGGKAYGYDAKLLPLVCEVYLLARDAHLEALKEAQERRKRGEQVEAKNILIPSQERIVQICDLLVRGMAKEHIVMLVDRATGYNDQEVRDELTKILEQYIAPHLMPYVSHFPDEFFKQVYKIYGWAYKPGNTQSPRYVGQFINTYIYGYLPPGVLEKLQELNPVTEAGYRKHKHSRFLTDTGDTHLDKQVTSTTTIMMLSENKHEFKENFARVHTKMLEQRKPKQLVIRVPKIIDQPVLFPISDHHLIREQQTVDLSDGGKVGKRQGKKVLQKTEG